MHIGFENRVRHRVQDYLRARHVETLSLRELMGLIVPAGGGGATSRAACWGYPLILDQRMRMGGQALASAIRFRSSWYRLRRSRATGSGLGVCIWRRGGRPVDLSAEIYVENGRNGVWRRFFEGHGPGLRSYSPRIARWICRDPVEELGSRLVRELPTQERNDALRYRPLGALDVVAILLTSGRENDSEGSNSYEFVLNSPATLFDLHGLKTQGLVSWKPIPGHAAILIDSCHCKGIFGFAPASLIPSPSGYWPGMVYVEPLSAISHYIKIGPEGHDGCFEKFLCDAISASSASPPSFHFSYYNCWSWVWDMIGAAAVQEAIAEGNGECCKYECK